MVVGYMYKLIHKKIADIFDNWRLGIKVIKNFTQKVHYRWFSWKWNAE